MESSRKKVNFIANDNITPGLYGLNDGRKKKKKDKKKRYRIRVFLTLLVFLVIGVFIFFRIVENKGRKGIGNINRIGATLSQNVNPFGDNVIFYDGTTLHCISATGGNEWSYQIGTNADYNSTDKKIVAWSGNDIYMLNEKGRLTYNNKMTDTIQFASAGNEYVAVFIGETDNGVISIINSSGQTIDNITVNNQTLLNIGFFEAAINASSNQKTELMWVMSVNTTGNVISTELQTFQPGKLSTGKSTLGEHIAYRVYDDNGILNLATTREIMHFRYRIVEDSPSTLIYGYTVEDVKKIGNTQHILLIPAIEQGNGGMINNVRIMYGNMDRMLHLPSSCITAKLGTRAVYAFSNSAVYASRYGDTTFETYALPINISAVLGMITDNRVVVASGSDIYIIELPM